MVINTVTDLIREYNQSSSGHWFDKDAVRWFRSRFRDKIYKGKYFISSEQFDYSSVRLYTIRIFTIDKGKIRIDTVGEFQEFGSYNQAEKYIKNNL